MLLYGINQKGYKVNIEHSNKKGEYRCSGCKMKIIPKKGVINKWHYAHKIKGNCDGANRSKTQWHLDWQKEFESDFVEVPFVNDTLKKMHIADVMIDDLVIEFQHSSITLDEIGERIWNYTATKNVIFVFDYRDSEINFSQGTYTRIGKQKFKNVIYNKAYYKFFFQIDENTLLKADESYDGFKTFTGKKYTKEEFLNFCKKTSEKLVKKNRDVTTSSYIDKVSNDISLENILNLKIYLQRRFYYNKDSKLFKKLCVGIDSFKWKEIDEIYDEYLLQKLDKRFCETIYQKACGEWSEGWGQYGDTNLWNKFGRLVFNDINIDSISENVKEVFMKKAKIEMIKKYIDFKISKGIIISPKDDNNQFIEELIKEIEARFLSGEYGYVLKEDIKIVIIENINLKNIVKAIKCVDEEKNKCDELVEYFIKNEVEFRKEYRKIKEYQSLIDWWENVSIKMLDTLGVNEICIKASGVAKGERVPAIEIYKSDIYEDINRLIINKIMKLAKEERTEVIDLFIHNKKSGQALLKFKYFTVTEQKRIGTKLGLNTKWYNSSVVKLRDDIAKKIKK